MSYVDNNLLKDEVVILKGKMHWILLCHAAFLCVAAYLFLGHTDQQFMDKILHTISFLSNMVGTSATPEQLTAHQGRIELVLCLIVLLIAIDRIIRYFCTEIVVTDKRFILKTGLIKRATYELNLNRVTGINVDQPVLGRILNYGNVTVESMGLFFGAPINYLQDPLTFRRVLLSKVETAGT